MNSLLSQIEKLNSQYNLFKPNQRILIALSGGVDSMVMLSLLNQMRFLVSYPIELGAAYISIHPVSLKGEEIAILDEQCNRYNIPFYLVVGEPISPELVTCYLCARKRRKHLFQIAVFQHYDTLAFGHNLDDYLETGLMNLIFQAKLESISPKQSMLGGRITAIRPLLDIPKKHIVSYAKNYRIPYIKHECPYLKSNRRLQVRELFNSICKINTDFRANLYSALKYWEHNCKKGE